MTAQERKLLEKIEKNVSKISENQAYLRGRLEEIHSRTAEIPSIVTSQAMLKRNVTVAWFFILAGMLVSAPAVFASLIALF
jgi:hypothetical protein